MSISKTWRRIAFATLIVVSSCAAATLAQQLPQISSPMVEHTRPHPRITDPAPEGQREKLEVGTLFVPNGVKKKSPLFIHFHGDQLIPEIAARSAKSVVISVQLGAGSGVYAKAVCRSQNCWAA